MDSNSPPGVQGQAETPKTKNETGRSMWLGRLSALFSSAAFLGAAASLSIAVGFLAWESRDSPTVIEPMSVPAPLLNYGITETQIARWIVGEVTRMQSIASDEIVYDGDREEKPTSLITNQVDFDLPAVGVSLSTLRRALSRARIIERNEVSGAVFCGIPDCHIGSLYALLNIGDRGVQVVRSGATDLENFVRDVSLEVLKETAPLDASAYLYKSGATNAAIRFLKGRLGSEIPERLDALHQLAIIYSNLGEFDLSKHYFNEALEAPGANRSAVINDFGVLYMRREMYGRAIEMFEDALELDSQSDAALLNWGVALRQQGRYVDAIEKYAHANSLDPYDSENLSNWGVALGRIGMYEEAARCHEMATWENPDNWEAFNNWAYALRRVGELRQAREQYSEAIRLKPDYAVALFNMGLVLRELGEHEAAFRAYGRALEVEPDYTRALVSWGIGLRELGRAEESAARLKDALEIEPHYSRALYHAALTARILGQVSVSHKLISAAVGHARSRQSARQDVRDTYSDWMWGTKRRMEQTSPDDEALESDITSAEPLEPNVPVCRLLTEVQ